MPTPGTLENRFWPRVDRNGGSDACWPWRKKCHRDGYGLAWFRAKEVTAHRVAWFLANGEIPAGKIVCHACDNPPCCNPAHLFLGTTKDNATDREQKGRGSCKLQRDRNGKWIKTPTLADDERAKRA